MFFTLGLLVFPSHLGDVAVEGTLLALVLAFVARPVAVAITTAANVTAAPAVIASGGNRVGCARSVMSRRLTRRRSR